MQDDNYFKLRLNHSGDLMNHVPLGFLKFLHARLVLHSAEEIAVVFFLWFASQWYKVQYLLCSPPRRSLMKVGKRVIGGAVKGHMCKCVFGTSLTNILCL